MEPRAVFEAGALEVSLDFGLYLISGGLISGGASLKEMRRGLDLCHYVDTEISLPGKAGWEGENTLWQILWPY